MSYLIHTDRSNLKKSLDMGLVRIPAGQEKQFNLYCLKRGDTIFFLEHENNMVHGPVFVSSSEVKKEKNPRTGPFNGKGNTTGHFRYISVEVDCSRIFLRGIPGSGADIDPLTAGFKLTDLQTLRILQKLRVENQPGIPLVIQVNLRKEYFNAMVIEVGNGTSIEHFSFILSPGIHSLIDRKKKEGESFLARNETGGFVENVKQMGSLVYRHILKKLSLERLFEKGGYRVDLVGDEYAGNIPLEIGFNQCFLFEKNIFAYRSEQGRGPENVVVRRILVLADPSGALEGAYTEGMKVYKFFCEMGLNVDFISRPLEKGNLVEMFPRYDLIHYSGHNQKKGRTEGWDLGDSLFRAEDIVPDEGLPHLIFVSACGTTVKTGFELLNKGVKNVILSRWRVPDHDWSEFILSFYQNLFDGIPSGYSYNLAQINSYQRKNCLPLVFIFMGESRLVYERESS